MSVLAERKPMTVEEFIAMPDSRDFELIDGNLVERKKVGARASTIAARILIEIGIFLKQTPLGWPFNSEIIYRCFGPNETGKRLDVSFIRRGRLPGERVPDADVRIAPDLAVEIVSPNDLAYEVNDKVSLYLKAGVALVWTVYPDTRSIEVFRADGSATFLREDQDISGESVLPGFRARVGEFFPPVENTESAEDPIR